MKTLIYMVRHAESPFKFGEERTRGLSEKGMHDSMKVANILTDKDIDAIYSSTYTRAVQTVQELAIRKGIVIEQYDELRERPIKGLDYKLPEHEILQAIEMSFQDKEFCLDGGESTEQAQKRAIPLIKKLLRDLEGKNIIVGTHGNIMTIIMNYFDEQYGFSFWESTSKPDIYELEFEKERLTNVKRLWS
ncbi:2,3-bisphosphoglycerate-dependent phosphoglycerate mutase [Paenibacillus sp. V4I9]|uniref:histidine phosphatase family protein n=1 Tax=Paenibacillus sp. V4I9 TaxID=3042308 RepID=UPI00277D6EB2|nr:histidine phosphatase family protein [Paenibacillus sp. V4I9]MDQ0888861.1 2,3-bisphosphoglycerate-dependent phosphoglycerate mutase [Paenibacillus sp. V4I9]